MWVRILPKYKTKYKIHTVIFDLFPCWKWTQTPGHHQKLSSWLWYTPNFSVSYVAAVHLWGISSPGWVSGAGLLVSRQVRTHGQTYEVQGLAVLFVAEGMCMSDGPHSIVSRCALSLSLSFAFISHRPLPHRELLSTSFSQPHPVCVISFVHKQGMPVAPFKTRAEIAWVSQRWPCWPLWAVEGGYLPSLRWSSTVQQLILFLLSQSGCLNAHNLSPVSTFWWASQQHSRHSHALLSSPVALVSLQDLTAETHTHGFDNERRLTERVRDTVKEKHRGSFLPISFTTEPWLSSQESVPLLHNKREVKEWETETDGGGVTLSNPPTSLPLCLSFWLLWFEKKGRKRGGE